MWALLEGGGQKEGEGGSEKTKEGEGGRGEGLDSKTAQDSVWRIRSAGTRRLRLA